MKEKIVSNLFLIAALVLIFAPAAFGALGDPDPSFGVGNSGKINDVLFLYRPNAIAVQPDGRILVAGHRTVAGRVVMVLRRYFANGAGDMGFGDSGNAVFYRGSHNYGTPAEIVVQDDGRILVIGTRTQSSTQRAVVWRFDANGFYDASWGVLGRVLLNGAWGEGLGVYYPVGSTVPKIFAGVSDSPDYRLYRLHAGGSLDDGFGGGDGERIVPIQHASMIVSDGAVFVAGRDPSDLQNVEVAKFTVDGTPFTDFGQNGVFNGNPFFVRGCNGYAENRFLAFGAQSGGRLIVGGVTMNESQTATEILLFRHQANGYFDTTFDMLPCDEPANSYYMVDEMKIADDDTIFFSSASWIYRRTVNGFPNGEFLPFVYSLDYLVQPDGKILSVGTDGHYVQLSRYLPD